MISENKNSHDFDRPPLTGHPVAGGLFYVNEL